MNASINFTLMLLPSTRLDAKSKISATMWGYVYVFPESEEIYRTYLKLTFFELIRGVLTVEAAVNRIEIITRIV